MSPMLERIDAGLAADDPFRRANRWAAVSVVLFVALAAVLLAGVM